MDNQSKQKLKGIITAKIKQAEDDIVDLEEMQAKLLQISWGSNRYQRKG